MFGDPLANTTYNGAAVTMPRISTSGTKSVYRSADGQFVMTISHQVQGLTIQSFGRLDRFVDVNSDGVLENESVHFVRKRPTAFFTETDTINLFSCLIGMLTASSNAGIKKIHGQET